jgi:spermidine synthase
MKEKGKWSLEDFLNKCNISKKSKCVIEPMSPYEAHIHGIKQFFVSKKTKYQKMDIAESFSFGKCLFLDGKMQSSEKDEYIYHELLVHPCLTAHPNPEKVFVVGGGEGATLREILKHNTVKKAVMVDIDEDVVKLSEKYLPEWSHGAFSDKRTKLYFEDARKYLEKTKEKFDAIIIDITEPLSGGPSYLLFTKEFYQIVSNRLENNGMISLQAGSTSPLLFECHASIYRTLNEVFPIVRTFQAFVPSFDLPWGFAIASKSTDPEFIRSRKIDKTLSERGVNGLKYYDGISHSFLFKVPKDMRESYKTGRIIRDNEPFFLIDS